MILGTPTQWFNPAAFLAPPNASGFYGNLGRDTLAGPGLATWDLSLVKDTRIQERLRLQFRAEVYNIISRPPKADGVCDKCGGPVVQREDDTEATAKKRLMVFEDQTHPLVAYYRGEQLLKEIDASRSPAAVEADLSAAIESTKAAR